MKDWEYMFMDIKCENCKVVFGGYYVESVWEANDEKSLKLLHPICDKCLIDPNFTMQNTKEAERIAG